MLYYEWKSRNNHDNKHKPIGVILFYKAKTSSIFRYILLLAGVGLLLVNLIIPQIETRNKDYESEIIHNYLPQTLNSIFNAISRPLFVVSIWMILMSPLTGHNSFITFVLGSKGYVPWARLTYMSYIVHLTVFDFYYNQQRQGTYLHHKSVIWVIFAWIFVTYLISIPISMWFEFPFTQIEKLLMFPGTSEILHKKIEEAAFRNMTMEKSIKETESGKIYFICIY